MSLDKTKIKKQAIKEIKQYYLCEYSDIISDDLAELALNGYTDKVSRLFLEGTSKSNKETVGFLN